MTLIPVSCGKLVRFSSKELDFCLHDIITVLAGAYRAEIYKARM